MSWDLYLPIARHSADLFLLLGLGGVVAAISGLFGVGGGFLMTPFLIKTTYVVMLGIVGSTMFNEALKSMRKRSDEAEHGGSPGTQDSDG
jgi:hypothetical protein